MRFTDIKESAVERASDKKVRLNKLFNQRAALRDQLRMAREEQDREKVSEIESKLGRLGDAIEELSESAAPLVAAKAKLAQLMVDLEDLPQNPGNEAGYDALDDLRDEIKKQKEKIKSLSEAAPQQDATQAFEVARDRAMMALSKLTAQIERFTKAQQGNARDWGYAGSMGHVASQLEEIVNHLGSGD
jgi:uncharacterized protein YigA (DUF484 family)